MDSIDNPDEEDHFQEIISEARQANWSLGILLAVLTDAGLEHFGHRIAGCRAYSIPQNYLGYTLQ